MGVGWGGVGRIGGGGVREYRIGRARSLINGAWLPHQLVLAMAPDGCYSTNIIMSQIVIKLSQLYQVCLKWCIAEAKDLL